jgi:hypothetical protein
LIGSCAPFEEWQNHIIIPDQRDVALFGQSAETA